MTSLMGDLIAERVSPNIGAVVCNAGGKLLKVVELQYKYGQADAKGSKDIALVEDKARPR